MLVDEIELTIAAGNGGKGKMSFGKMERGPDGGNGGKGGDVIALGSSDLTLLAQYASKREIVAESGIPGGKDKLFGKNGEDLFIEFPVGSHFTDLNTKEVFTLRHVGERLFLCRGGTGGIGNFELRSPTNTTPMTTIPAISGQRRRLRIVLKFIADFGLIGIPSSGKSSLLNALTNANVKTAAYHFTTLSPNLGVLSNKKILADIPGLIEGASVGKGLGIKFLKHIQKVSLLLHCIAADSPNPLTDYEVVRKELGEFDASLLEKEEVILLTKSDLVGVKELKAAETKLKKLKRRVVPVSIYNLDELIALTELLT